MGPIGPIFLALALIFDGSGDAADFLVFHSGTIVARVA
jgi:hypothetical protein